MERKIGEIFTYNGKTYQVVKGFSCNGCVFIKDGSCYSVSEFLGPCDYANRTDKTGVIFKEMKGMEIKNNQLTIEIPEGIEIDILNSNFGAGVICFKKKQPEFKDGDILYAEKDESHIDAIFILKTVKEERGYYACLILYPYMVCKYSCGGIGNKTLRYATEEEKQQLFDALAKEGKAWDAEKKQIVDLKPKWTPKPFDKVMTRVDRNAIWSANIFSHIDQNGEYVTIGCIAGYPYCLPYNEETAHLLGTTDDWEG